MSIVFYGIFAHPGENPQALQSLIRGGRCMEVIQVGCSAMTCANIDPSRLIEKERGVNNKPPRCPGECCAICDRLAV